jgi:uncharacterized protein (DUF433 family)
VNRSAAESALVVASSVEYGVRTMTVPRGAYPADRAAALSGVPLSTVHWWAREGILLPSVSAQRIKLWSYPDLMGLRIIYWLRHWKTSEDGAAVPRSAMPDVRRALTQLRELDLDLWSEDTGPAVAVDRSGTILITKASPDAEAPYRQRRTSLPSDELLQVLRPFATQEGQRGPDLHSPRPELRIVPGKLGGAPHITRTRVETEALAALARDRLPITTIVRLYPHLPPEAIDAALDLERQLTDNLRTAVAA